VKGGTVFFVDIEEALVSFGSALCEARRRYLEFVRLYAETRSARAGIRTLPWWSTVTNDDETVAPTFGKRYQDFNGKAVSMDRPQVTLAELAVSFCECLDIDIDEVACRSTKRGLAEIRAIFASVAVEYFHHTSTDVATLLGKHPGSVSRYLEHGRKLRKTEDFRQILRIIDHTVRSNHTIKKAPKVNAIRPSTDSRL
jgi:predicted transcriptional regulator